MPFSNILDPEHRAILTALLDDICAAAGIGVQSHEGEAAANLIMHLYGRGNHTSDGLKAMLEAGLDEEARRHA